VADENASFIAKSKMKQEDEKKEKEAEAEEGAQHARDFSLASLAALAGASLNKGILPSV